MAAFQPKRLVIGRLCATAARTRSKIKGVAGDT
jgi:hypothetical protein